MTKIDPQPTFMVRYRIKSVVDRSRPGTIVWTNVILNGLWSIKDFQAFRKRLDINVIKRKWSIEQSINTNKIIIEIGEELGIIAGWVY